ncbi:ABC transporter permease [Haloglycomyces albus]|uniref:ABC transporter permease n=1 Tax=Haloglycomyces albus TaxID=526067 RepID=UPI00046D3AE3|nr:ABC transporter permease subunit [Haloglycomyces albus]
MSDFVQYLHDWFYTYVWKPLPEMKFGEWGDQLVKWLDTNWAPLFNGITDGMTWMFDSLVQVFTYLPSGIMIIILALVAWACRSWKLGLGMGIFAFVIAWTPYWHATMETLAMVFISTVVATVLAIPLGVWASHNATVSRMIRPVLDFMQTLPAFVYLIPVVILFSPGVVPGMIATIVFCMPPGVRFTELGIRQVDKETIEAGQAFGASPWSILTRIKLPLALPTIMAGLNQVIMLSLSMVVIAGLVGGDGLGQEINSALSHVRVEDGINAGLAVAFLAIFLDRVSQGLSDRTPVARAQRLANS